ncbi:LysR family transcriptional regulator [Ideonella sp. B7]|uniref:LysR family transcriptional regulator n=1 Tax=Ideonella benzenivorans TaxID=2831643 RepID=UPI001CEC81BE|nr:LysR family transcriptional regulator [Ideonella benzenivorans]MCA6215497.1 LysR family transcriptional regulator [Ideonella benzenivorans]
MTSSISWELYRTFLGVLEHGSLSAAARALDLTQPTVGRQLAALEQALGLTLFTRSPTGVQPTQAALALRAPAQAVQHAARALERTAASQGAGVQGVVRVTASEVVGVAVLPPILAALRARHPGLTVELALSNRLQDLLQREADIAVRMQAPQQGALLARRVGAIEVGLHAHPDYLARHGTPQDWPDLAGHSLIGFDTETAYIRQVGAAWPALRRERFALRTDSDVAQLALIRAGAGIGPCQVGLAQRGPALVRVLPAQFALPLDTWVTMHEDLRHSPRCQVTFEALVQGLLDYRSSAAAPASVG